MAVLRSLHLKDTVGIGGVAAFQVQMKVMPHAAVPREHDHRQIALVVKGSGSRNSLEAIL